VQKRILHLLKKQPDAAKQKNERGLTPLHSVIYNGRAPLEVVAALLEVWPEAAKEKDTCGRTPLHYAPPFEVMDALLKAWPEAVNEKDEFGDVPLQVLCGKRASFEVMYLLLKTWLGYKENRTKSAIMSLQRGTTVYADDAVKVPFSHLFALFNNNADNPSPKEVLDYFVNIEMWNGATLVLNRNPAVIKTMGLDTKAMADLLSTVGRCCSLKAMWEVIRNEQDLLEGV